MNSGTAAMAGRGWPCHCRAIVMPLDGQAIAALFGSSSIVCFYGENRMGRQGERGELEAPTRDQLIRYREKTRSTTHRRFLRAEHGPKPAFRETRTSSGPLLVREFFESVMRRRRLKETCCMCSNSFD